MNVYGRQDSIVLVEASKSHINLDIHARPFLKNCMFAVLLPIIFEVGR